MFTLKLERRKMHTQTKIPSRLNTELLRAMSGVLNRYQDICDVLEDKSLSDGEKIKRITEINNQIGLICAETLPG